MALLGFLCVTAWPFVLKEEKSGWLVVLSPHEFVDLGFSRDTIGRILAPRISIR